MSRTAHVETLERRRLLASFAFWGAIPQVEFNQLTGPDLAVAYDSTAGTLLLESTDLNADGWNDLFWLTLGEPGYPHRAHINLTRADGTFDYPLEFGAGEDPRWIATGDFNLVGLDGRADFAIYNYYGYGDYGEFGVVVDAWYVYRNVGNWWTKSWIGPASGGDWSTPSNWSPAGVPTPSDAVLISSKSVSLSNSTSIGKLFLTHGATLTLPTAGNQVLRTSVLSISGSAKLDLNGNALILDYPGDSPVAAVRGHLVSGRNGGAWNGEGINSSAAPSLPGSGLGYAEATDLFSAFPASFAGQSIDSTSILVRHTLLGDATLDGKVDVTDLGRLATNWQQTQRHWSHGDFNYDGTVDIADLSLLASNWTKSLAPPATASPKHVVQPDRAPRLIDQLESVPDANVLPA